MVILMNIFGLNTNNNIELGIFIVACIVVLFVIVLVAILIISSIPHTCTYCHTNKTTDTDDNDEYQCQSCREGLLIKAAKRKEKTRICPDCGKDMDKQVIDGTDIVADVCTSCKGVFLDKGELEAMEEQLEIEEITFNPITSIAVMNIISH